VTKPDTEIILSLGAGVQSTCLALMALDGALPPEFGTPKAAIFADTGFEPHAVYENVRWLLGILGERIPLYVVRAQRPDGTPADIREDSAAIVLGTRSGPTPPLFVKPSVEYTPYPVADRQAMFEEYLIRRGEIPKFVTMPLYAREFTGGPIAPLRRQCTGDYKLEPIYKFVKPFIGRKRGQRYATPPWCEMWIGISAEEKVKRCKPATEGWVTNRWPLRELGMSRQACDDWTFEHYGRRVMKSACIACPYHDDAYWLVLQRESPDEFEQACAFDDLIRHLPGVKGDCYVHSSGVPLRDIDFTQSRSVRRKIALGQALLFGEDEKVCSL
jgi:hypothetical protein